MPAREVLDTALTNIWQRWRRSDETPDIDDVPRYCSIVIRNVVRNLATGFDRHDLAELDELERRAVVEGDGGVVGGGGAGVVDAGASRPGTRDDTMRAALEAAPAAERINTSFGATW